MFEITRDEKKFAKLFDTSLLRATNVQKEYEVLCDEALNYKFACIAVNGMGIKYCADRIKGTDIRLTCATSFPLGLCTLDTKLAEAENAFKDGATDIDLVLNVSKILDHEYSYIEKEVKAITELCRKEGKVSKIIFETCFLKEGEITELCKITNEYCPDFIKTCTGTQGPATVEAVELMRKLSLPEIKVKASGGVHNLEKAEIMLAAGAERLGTITADFIMKEYDKKYCK